MKTSRKAAKNAKVERGERAILCWYAVILRTVLSQYMRYIVLYTDSGAHTSLWMQRFVGEAR